MINFFIRNPIGSTQLVSKRPICWWLEAIKEDGEEWTIERHPIPADVIDQSPLDPLSQEEAALLLFSI